MIALYHASGTRSHLVRFCLEELGLAHEVRRIDASKGEHKSPEYLRVNPHGQLPALVDGDNTLRECAAICMHLTDRVPASELAPAVGSVERGLYYQWCLYAIATELIPLTKIALHTRFFPPEMRSEATAEEGRRQWVEVARVLSDALSGRSWLLGDRFTTADVLVGGSLWLASFVGVLAPHAELVRYYGRVRERPAFQRAFGDAPPASKEES